MIAEFNLTTDQLVSMVKHFSNDLDDGFTQKAQDIQCLPTYLGFNNEAYSGQIYVVDLGGSNLRAARAFIEEGRVELMTDVFEYEMPWQRGTEFSKKQYLAAIANIIAKVSIDAAIPLGFCFSYPCESLPSGDAILSRWTKGIYVNDTEQCSVTHDLVACLRDEYQIEINAVQVINDTVASLLAGCTANKHEGYIGLIAGTGFNISALVATKAITKISDAQSSLMPVNFECGNFKPDFLTKYDRKIDQQSEQPNQQLLEKVAGSLYLSRVFALVYPESGINPQAGAKALVEIMSRFDDAHQYHQLAVQLYKRSALFTGMALTATCLKLHETQAVDQVKIVAEGALFWSSTPATLSYKKLVETTIDNLLQVMQYDIKVEIVKVENANMIGLAHAFLPLEAD
ncbi:hexokinase family protein [Algibacillus agarilyticus]|uniref:hexokinase family protein n=1 Tax=Algibacillus agarilyticus TaxID=2234133 RepID=UPI000DD0A279|nr:hypothetical protein [Algibacillus agarilyticus]